MRRGSVAMLKLVIWTLVGFLRLQAGLAPIELSNVDH